MGAVSGESYKDGVTPRLRFPGFQGDWGAHTFAEVARRITQGVATDTVALDDYVTTENLLPDFAGVTRAANLPPVASVNCFKCGDVLLANIRPYLKKGWQADREGAASNDVFVFRSREKIDPELLAQRVLSDKFIEHVMTGAKGVKMPRGDFTQIKEFPCPLPNDLAEQRKIAACLGSLDAWLAAEDRKLAALARHKRGLLQQLFPREGQTRPHLRFPEFRDAGDWKTAKAGDLFDRRSEKGEPGLPIYSVTTDSGMVERSSFDRNFYDIADAAGNRKVCKGDIAYNTMRMWQGACGVAPMDCMVSPAYVILAPRDGVDAAHFELYFKLPPSLQVLTAYSRGLTADRLRLYFDDFAAVPVCFPSREEQRRIAACLSTLDARLAAQAEKIATLRAHKRGLMQQLFPAPAPA